MSQANDVIVVAAQKCLSSQGRNRPKPAKNGLKPPTFRLIPRRNESISRQNESVSSRCQSIPSRSPSIPRRGESVPSRSQSISRGHQPRFPPCESTWPSFGSAWPQCLPASQADQSELCWMSFRDVRKRCRCRAGKSSNRHGRVASTELFVWLGSSLRASSIRATPPRRSELAPMLT